MVIPMMSRQLTAAKPREALTAGSIRAGVHGGSKVIVTSAEATPGTAATALSAPSLRKLDAAHPGVVAVGDGDVIDEAEIDDVLAELGIDHDAQRVADLCDQLIRHDGALTVSS